MSKWMYNFSALNFIQLISFEIQNIFIEICANLFQVFVETLDRCFENVCELDLIFHVDKVVVIIRLLSFHA